MKKKWIEPQILVQEFVPNEYVAACGDKNKVYKFKCTADAGNYIITHKAMALLMVYIEAPAKQRNQEVINRVVLSMTQVQQMVFMMDMFIHPHTKGSFRGGIGQKIERLLLYGVASTETMVMQPQI